MILHTVKTVSAIYYIYMKTLIDFSVLSEDIFDYNASFKHM